METEKLLISHVNIAIFQEIYREACKSYQIILKGWWRLVATLSHLKEEFFICYLPLG